MAHQTGLNAYITFADVDISGDSRTVDFGRSVEALDVTTFGSSGYRDYLAGLIDAPITVDAVWDNATAATSLDLMIHQQIEDQRQNNSTKAVWEFAPEGSATDRILYSGSGYVTQSGINNPVDGVTTLSLTIQNSGSISRGLIT